MAGIVSLASNQVQRIVLGLTRLTNTIGTVALAAIIDWHPTPPRVRPIVPRVHAAVFHQHHIIGISESRGINLYRTTADKHGLVLSAIATKRIVKVIDSVSIFIIKRWQIISAVANLQKIYLKDGSS